MSVDRAAGFIVAVLLGPGVEEVADLPRRVAGAASVHFEDELLVIIGPIVPFRVRFDNNNTIRTLELSLQAAGTDG